MRYASPKAVGLEVKLSTFHLEDSVGLIFLPLPQLVDSAPG